MTEETQHINLTSDACERPSQKWLLVGLIIAVCSVVIAVYWPALSAKALSWDDNQYVIENKLVRNPGFSSAWRFLTEVLHPSSVEGYYQPLTMISLMLDYASGGRPENPLVFHRTSLLLHAANTALIIALLSMLFRRVWIAAAVGLLFGIHPLTVETISWVSERKTLLASFFVLLSLILYVRFTRKNERKFFVWSLVMYALALMSKPTSTPLPAMMLLMDFWPLRRLKTTCVREKIPFFIVGGVAAIITFISQSRSASVVMPQQYGAMRVPLVICHNIIFYLFKMVWPVNQTSHYPFPQPLDLSQPMVLAGVIGTCILIIALLVSLIWTRAALTGWLIFLIMVLPTMQVVQFSDVIASDKFVYLPSIGLLLAITAFLGWLCNKSRRRCTAITAVVLFLATSEAVATRNYLKVWQSSYTLFSYMVNMAPDDASPHYNLGSALMDKGDIEGARREFETLLKLTPKATDALYGLASTYVMQDRIDEAIKRYSEILELKPGHAHAYGALAYMQIKKDQPQHAIELYNEGLKYNPQDELLHGGLGLLFLQIGRVDEAIPELETSAKLSPDPNTYSTLATAYTLKGYTKKAAECYQKVTRLNPANAEAHYNLGNIYLGQNQFAEAVIEYQKAIKAKPDYSKAYGNLGVALAQMGKTNAAIENFRRAIEIDPNNTDAHFNLAGKLADIGLADKAIEHLKKIIELSPHDSFAHCRLAELLLTEKDQPEQAIAEYEQVLKIDPNNTDAQIGLQKARSMQTTGGKSNNP